MSSMSLQTAVTSHQFRSVQSDTAQSWLLGITPFSSTPLLVSLQVCCFMFVQVIALEEVFFLLSTGRFFNDVFNVKALLQKHFRKWQKKHTFPAKDSWRYTGSVRIRGDIVHLDWDLWSGCFCI